MEDSTGNPNRDIKLTREVALIAVFTTLTFLSTTMFQFSLVSTSGYFNLGEVFVYLSALVGGPIVGATAGGLGSAFADIFLGAGYFAPATLVLKGLEGFVVGFLYQLAKKSNDKTVRSSLTLVTYMVLSWITLFIVLFSFLSTTPSWNVFEGEIELFNVLITINMPSIVVILFSLILSVLIWYVELKMGHKGKMILSCLMAGPIIVVGYFIWEVFVLRLTIEIALFEVPFNIAQVIFGTLIAVPVMSYLDEIGILDQTQHPEDVLDKILVTYILTSLFILFIVLVVISSTTPLLDMFRGVIVLLIVVIILLIMLLFYSLSFFRNKFGR